MSTSLFITLVVFGVITLWFFGLLGKVRMLGNMIGNIFIADVTKNPKACKALFNKKIEGLEEAHTKTKNNLKLLMGKKVEHQRKIKDLDLKIQDELAKCKALKHNADDNTELLETMLEMAEMNEEVLNKMKSSANQFDNKITMMQDYVNKLFNKIEATKIRRDNVVQIMELNDSMKIAGLNLDGDFSELDKTLKVAEDQAMDINSFIEGSMEFEKNSSEFKMRALDKKVLSSKAQERLKSL